MLAAGAVLRYTAPLSALGTIAPYWPLPCLLWILFPVLCTLGVRGNVQGVGTTSISHDGSITLLAAWAYGIAASSLQWWSQ